MIAILSSSCNVPALWTVRSRAVLMNVNNSLLKIDLGYLMMPTRTNVLFESEHWLQWWGKYSLKIPHTTLFLSLTLTWNLLVSWSFWKLIPERWVCSSPSIPLCHYEFAARGRFDLQLYSNNHNSKQMLTDSSPCLPRLSQSPSLLVSGCGQTEPNRTLSAALLNNRCIVMK